VFLRRTRSGYGESTEMRVEVIVRWVAADRSERCAGSNAGGMGLKLHLVLLGVVFDKTRVGAREHT
jgi:hypothetical protein